MSESQPQRPSIRKQIEALLSCETDIERMFAAVLDACAMRTGNAAFFITERDTLRGWRTSDGRSHRDISSWSIPQQSGALYGKMLAMKPFVASLGAVPPQSDELKALDAGEQVSDWSRSLLGDAGTDKILCVPWSLGGTLAGLFLFACREEPGERALREMGEAVEALANNVLRLYSRERGTSVAESYAKQPVRPIPVAESERITETRDEPARPEKSEEKPEEPTLPKLLPKLLALHSEDAVAEADLKRMVAADPALQAKVLKLASSPYYCMGVEPQTFDEAMSLLDFEVFRGAVLAARMSKMFLGNGASQTTEARTRMWRHSLACASIARIVAGHIPGDGCEFAFAAGLLHDVGRLIFYLKSPNEFNRWMTETAKITGSIIAGERKIFNQDHTGIGAKWAEENALPEAIVRAISEHHSAETGGEPSPLAAIIEFADVVCRRYGIGLVHRPDITPYGHKSWLRLNLPEEVLEQIETDLPLILAAESLCI